MYNSDQFKFPWASETAMSSLGSSKQTSMTLILTLLGKMERKLRPVVVSESRTHTSAKKRFYAALLRFIICCVLEVCRACEDDSKITSAASETICKMSAALIKNIASSFKEPKEAIYMLAVAAFPMAPANSYSRGDALELPPIDINAHAPTMLKRLSEELERMPRWRSSKIGLPLFKR